MGLLPSIAIHPKCNMVGQQLNVALLLRSFNSNRKYSRVKVKRISYRSGKTQQKLQIWMGKITILKHRWKRPYDEA